MLKNDDIIIGESGVTTQTQAAVCFRQGGNLPKIHTSSLCSFLSLSGIRKDGVSCVTFVTPAGSFFVPDVTIRGKSRKTLTQGGRLMPYTTIADELRSAVRCSRRVALRATMGQKTHRSRDINRINLATLEANILSIAEKAEMDWDKYCIEKGGNHA